MDREEYEEFDGGYVKRGGYGTVRPMKRQSDGKIVACKSISFDLERYRTKADFRTKVEREVTLLKRLDHPNVVRFFDMQWLDDEGVKIYTEHLQDQDLDFYVSQNYNKPDWPTEVETWSLICQLSSALAYCHHGLIRIHGIRDAKVFEQKDWVPILHRDVKPENVLVQRKPSGHAVFKLCDFGLGVTRSPEDMKQMSFGGTRPFIAPEVTEDEPCWSYKADIFALGCKTCDRQGRRMYIHKLTKDEQGTYYYYYKRLPPWRYHLTNALSTTAPTLPDHAPQAVRDLIYSCIAFSAEDRPHAGDLFTDALEHLEERDRALASLDTLHTSSEVRAEPRTQVLQDLSRSSSFDRWINIETSPPDSTLRPPQRDQTTITSTQDLQADHRTLSNVAIRRNDETGTFESLRLEEWIGSLVIDYTRFPPVESTKTIGNSPKKEIVRTVVGTDVKFHAVRDTTDTLPKRKKWSITRTAQDGRSSVRDVIEADLCEEYLLLNAEEFWQYWQYSIMISDDNRPSRGWVKRKIGHGKTVYIVVGYIVYLNARVQEGPSGSYSNTSKSTNSFAGRIFGASGTATPTGSATSEKTYEKRGYQIQAVMVRKIDIKTRAGYSGVFPDQAEYATLGPIETAYFWGPSARPDDR